MWRYGEYPIDTRRGGSHARVAADVALDSSLLALDRIVGPSQLMIFAKTCIAGGFAVVLSGSVANVWRV